MKYKYAVVGAGAWGTAIANFLAKNNNDKVLIWAKEDRLVDQINKYNRNDLFLPEINLEKNIIATNQIKDIIADYIFYVTPSQFFKKILIKHKKYIPKTAKVIICSKGIEINTGFMMSDIFESVLLKDNYFILSGPSFAKEVASGLPAALVIASIDIKESISLANIISKRNFRIYPSDDVAGVQLGGAIKNIYAIGAGIVKGLNYGENARAAFLTRCIAEMVKICDVMGGKKETIYGLSCIGDILLTCNSEKSRNFVLGKSLGEGKEIKNILTTNKTIAEGYFTTQAFFPILNSNKIDAPIMIGIYNILFNNFSLKTVVNSLLNRPVKNSEFD